jgi:hypothetical protein
MVANSVLGRWPLKKLLSEMTRKTSHCKNISSIQQEAYRWGGWTETQINQGALLNTS